jgi:hypothetical protein
MTGPLASGQTEERGHPMSFGAGVFFVLAGLVFLLEWLDAFELSGAVWPVLLICLGMAVGAEGATSRRGRPLGR